jgi:hypothetical protein
VIGLLSSDSGTHSTAVARAIRGTPLHPQAFHRAPFPRKRTRPPILPVPLWGPSPQLPGPASQDMFKKAIRCALPFCLSLCGFALCGFRFGHSHRRPPRITTPGGLPHFARPFGHSSGSGPAHSFYLALCGAHRRGCLVGPVRICSKKQSDALPHFACPSVALPSKGGSLTHFACPSGLPHFARPFGHSLPRRTPPTHFTWPSVACPSVALVALRALFLLNWDALAPPRISALRAGNL